MNSRAQERFAAYLRDEARVAEERSANADDNGVSDIAERNARATERLRALADNVSNMSPEEIEHLEQMGDEAIRGFAKAMRFYDPDGGEAA